MVSWCLAEVHEVRGVEHLAGHVQGHLCCGSQGRMWARDKTLGACDGAQASHDTERCVCAQSNRNILFIDTHLDGQQERYQEGETHDHVDDGVCDCVGTGPTERGRGP